MMRTRQYDRFIPIRGGRDILIDPSFSADKLTEASTNYSRILTPSSTKYLKFSTPRSKQPQSLTQFILKQCNSKQTVPKTKQTRKANRILDAPNVINNFYYNPLDWSKGNMLGIALAEGAYLLCEGKEVLQFDRCSSIHISCVKFHGDDDSLCLLGENSGRVEVYDCERMTRIRQIKVHYNRVGVMLNSDFPEAFLSGSKDNLIKLNDLRIRKTDVATLQKHSGEVCGLSIANYYLASGGNDNKVVIWDLRKIKPINQLKEHKSAVKALAWCPWKTSLLASGGGREDKKIVLWNGNKNLVEQKIETSSQIMALQWKEDTKSLVSGHSNGKNSYCIVWNGAKAEIKLKGHEGRLLGMKINPKTGKQIWTVASDETLRFWDISDSCQQNKVQCEKRTFEVSQSDCR